MRLAVEGGFNGVALQVGAAERFFWEYAGEVPLVLKLNGKTEIPPDEAPLSPLNATVADAVRLGADAVGYTLYVGSARQDEDFAQSRRVRTEAERLGMPVIVWAYPRGAAVERAGGRNSLYAVDYAARVAAELGADLVNIWQRPHDEALRMVRVVLGFTVLTLGLGAFLLYGVVVLVFLHQLPGVRVLDDAAAVLAAIVLGGITAGLTGLLDIDDDEFFQRRAARRARRRRGPASELPGVLFVQVDGLGHDVLRHAARDGDAPTLAAWMAAGTHRLVPWETDWSAQTSASQCAAARVQRGRPRLPMVREGRRAADGQQPARGRRRDRAPQLRRPRAAAR